MIVVMAVVFFVLLLLSKRNKGSVFNGFFFVVGPYVFILVFNNLFFVHNGFFMASNETIIFYFIMMVLFYIGSTIGTIISKYSPKEKKVVMLSSINETTLRFVAILCEIIVALDILIHIRMYGLSNFVGGEEMYNRSSLSSHLTLLLVVLCVLLFDYYLETKHRIDLVLTVVAFGVIFASFTKYHIISTVLIILIYVAIKRPEHVKKIGIMTAILIVVLFMSNYALGFAAAQVTGIPKNFYVNHLWGYVSGGVMNYENAVEHFGQNNPKLSLTLWILEMILKFPSMITNKLLGFVFTEYNFAFMMPFFSLGGSVSNVLCIPAAAFVQGDNLSFCLFIVAYGILVEYFFTKAKQTQSIRMLLPASVFIAYSMLSFFAAFFELTAPWETIILAYLIIPLLKIKIVCRG